MLLINDGQNAMGASAEELQDGRTRPMKSKRGKR